LDDGVLLLLERLLEWEEWVRKLVADYQKVSSKPMFGWDERRFRFCFPQQSHPITHAWVRLLAFPLTPSYLAVNSEISVGLKDWRDVKSCGCLVGRILLHLNSFK
jgi:hypothetical protein